MNLAMPFSEQTFVNADVKVVLPWSTCPIVPMLTCGLRRPNFAFDMPHSFSDGAHDADRTRDLVLTKDVLYQLSYVGSLSSRITSSNQAGDGICRALAVATGCPVAGSNPCP